MLFWAQSKIQIKAKYSKDKKLPFKPGSRLRISVVVGEVSLNQKKLRSFYAPPVATVQPYRSSSATSLVV